MAYSDSTHVPADVKTQAVREGEARSTAPSLDSATLLTSGVWMARTYPECGEGTAMRASMYPKEKACCRRALDESRACDHKPKKGEVDEARSRASAGRRASVKMRRYCTRNRLSRLVTLTYAGEGVHDARSVAEHMKRFLARLKEALGMKPGESLPFMWVRELHPGGHGFHVHMAIGRYVHHETLKRVWGHGIVDVRKIRMTGAGAGGKEAARRAASYLAKYVAKTWTSEPSLPKGSRRYSVAQGFQPSCQAMPWASLHEALGWAASWNGGELPRVTFSSDDYGPSWEGPPLRVWFWT